MLRTGPHGHQDNEEQHREARQGQEAKMLEAWGALRHEADAEGKSMGPSRPGDDLTQESLVLAWRL